MVPHFETVKQLDKQTYISSGARNIEKHRNLNFPQLLPIQTTDTPLGHSQKKTGLCGNLPTWPPKVFPKVGQTYLGHIDPGVIKYKHQCWEFQIKKCKCWSHIFERNIYANFSFITVHIPLISELQYVSCLVLVGFTNFQVRRGTCLWRLIHVTHSCYSEFHRLDYPFI